MLKKIIYFIFFLVLFACESSSDSSSIQSRFTIDLTSSATQTNVDQEFIVTLSANEPIKTIMVSYDNFATIVDNLSTSSDFGTDETLVFNFDVLGTKTIYIKAYNASGQFTTKAVTVNVNRGNAVKIIGMQITSFYNINSTWDPEFGASDPNRLADVFFGFNKSKISSPIQGTYSVSTWYKSTVKQNQEDLTWNTTTGNLYIDPTKTIRMGVVDEDVPPLGQNLLNSIQDYKDFSLSGYTVTKPTSITYSYPEIGLEFILQVEWPN